MCHQGRSLGVSKLRFLPKPTGVRPIINLNSRVKLASEQAKSVNYQLDAAFHVLNLEMVGEICAKTVPTPLSAFLLLFSLSLSLSSLSAE